MVFYSIYDLTALFVLNENCKNDHLIDLHFFDLCVHLAIKCLINKGLLFTLMVTDLPGSYSGLTNSRQHVGLLLEIK